MNKIIGYMSVADNEKCCIEGCNDKVVTMLSIKKTIKKLPVEELSPICNKHYKQYFEGESK